MSWKTTMSFMCTGLRVTLKILTLPVAEELALNQDLVDSVRWQDKARKLGERFSARTGVQPGDKGSLYRTPETLTP